MKLNKCFVLAVCSFISVAFLTAENSYSLFKHNGKYGLINNDLDIQIKPEYESIDITPDYYVFKNTGNGKTFIYNSDLRHVYNPYKYLFITPVAKSTCMIAEGFNDFVLLDTETGIKTKLEITEFVNWPYGSDTDHYASGWYYLAEDFRTKNLERADFIKTYPFVDGCALIMKKAPANYQGGTFDIIDDRGRTILSEIRDTAEYFSEGLLAVEMMNGRSGFVNIEGDFVFLCDMDVDYSSRRTKPAIKYMFRDGKAVVKSDKTFKWHIYGMDGKSVEFPANYETDCYVFKEDLLPVYQVVGEKRWYGYINKEGEMVLPPMLQHAEPFINGYAIVKFRDKDAIMDKEGNVYLSETLVNEDKTVFRNITHY